MNWLICSISSFILAGCMAIMFFIARDEKKNLSTKDSKIFYFIYTLLFFVNFISGILDLIFRTDYSVKTTVINIVCAVICLALVVPFTNKKIKEKKVAIIS